MSIVIQRQFNGGLADDIRESSTNSCSLIQHFDFYSKPNRLTPYRDMENEAGSLSAYAIKDVALCTDSNGTQNLFALGNVSGQTYPQFLEKSVNMVTGTFATSTNGNDSTGVVIGNSLMTYKNRLLAMKTLSGNTVVIAYNPATDALSTIGTITGTSSVSVYPKPFRHPQDDIVYFGAGNVVASLNNVTFTASALVLPSDLVITSFVDYGVYLAISCAPKDVGGKSYVFLWGRDTTLTTVQETVDFGEGTLMILDNVGGTLVGISGITFGTSTVFDITPKITVRAYSGGTPRIVKEIKSESSSQTLRNYKAKSKDNLYFTASTYINGQTINQLWVCGKSPSGSLFVAPDRLINNDTALTGYVDGFAIVGDYLWAGYNADGSLKRTNDTALYTATSVYETLINPSMPLADRTKQKQLKGVSLSYAPLPASGQVVLQYSVDGGSYTTIFTETTDNKITTEKKTDSTGNAFVSGREYKFKIQSTGGAEITELKYEYTTLQTLL